MARRYRSPYRRSRLRRRLRSGTALNQRGTLIAAGIGVAAAMAGGVTVHPSIVPAVAHAVTGHATTASITVPHPDPALTSGQQEFAAALAAGTGLSYQVVSAWELAEESGPAAQARQAAGNNDWLNIGYTDAGTYGAGDAIWSSPVTAGQVTGAWLKGQNVIPGYGQASSGVQAILATAGQSPAAQIAAIQNSGWASSGYPDLPGLYRQATG
jgi:hypothetical protein